MNPVAILTIGGMISLIISYGLATISTTRSTSFPLGAVLDRWAFVFAILAIILTVTGASIAQ
jgi:hypothetical protein